MVKSGNPRRHLQICLCSGLQLWSCLVSWPGSAAALLFYCRFSGVDFLADFLKMFWVCEIFFEKVVEKFGGELESAYLCTRFRKPTGPEGPAERLEQ